MKSTKKALFTSIVTMLICISMFIGSTFAWFTDTVSSGTNQINAGNLDVEVYHKSASVTLENQKIDGSTALFTDKQGKSMLWEPGAVTYETFTVKNVGSLALKYNMSMIPSNYNYVVEAGKTVDERTNRSLLDVLKVLIIDGTVQINSREQATQLFTAEGAVVKTLSDFVTKGYLVPTAKVNDTDKDSKDFTVVIYWPSDSEAKLSNVVDNDYNLKNGAYASDASAQTVGKLHIDLGINLVATQYTYESDSFDNSYDETAELGLPSVGTKVSTTLTKAQINGNDAFLSTELGSVTVPSSALPEDNDYSLRLDIERVENDSVESEFQIQAGTGNTLATYDVSLIKVVGQTEEKMSNTDKVYTVTVFVGKYNDVVKFYHKGQEISDFVYDENTGFVTFKTKSFSPYATEYKFAGGLGNEEHPYLIANREQMQAIKDDYTSFKSFKVADGVVSIDCSGWNPVRCYGNFDGNNAVFNNLDAPLFHHIGPSYSVASSADYLFEDLICKNIKINADIHYSDDTAAVCWYANSNLTLDNIRVTGYVEGYGNTGLFLGYGCINSKIQKFKFVNCKSDANIVVTSGPVGIFVGHGFCASGSSLEVTDCEFSGNMSSNTKTGGLMAIRSGVTTISINGQSDSFSNSGSEIYKPYNSEHIGKIACVTGQNPAKYSNFIINTVEGFDHAVATLMCMPEGNGTSHKGTGYSTVYLVETTENEELVYSPEENTLSTTNIKFYDFVCNENGTPDTGMSYDIVDNTLKISDYRFGNDVGYVYVRIMQYDSNNNVINITTFKLR